MESVYTYGGENRQDDQIKNFYDHANETQENF